MARPRSKIAPAESVKLDAATLATVRDYAVHWHLPIEAALARLVRVGLSEMAFPLAVGERAIVRAAQSEGYEYGAQYQLRVGLSSNDLHKIKGPRS